MKHLAIIMDWNRRWAAEQWLETQFGHKAWAENIEKIVLEADKRWIEFITLWWLSTENLEKRWAKEVTEIIKLIVWAKKYLKTIIENNGKIEIIWDIEKLPHAAKVTLNYLTSKTKDNTGIVVVIALVYGGKNEIIRWIKKFVSEWWDLEMLDEQSFWKYLDTWIYPPPDMIVRTGWDIRHSGFLLYQSDYSEYYFTEKKWPEFDGEELDKVVAQFEWYKRNFWK